MLKLPLLAIWKPPTPFLASFGNLEMAFGCLEPSKKPCKPFLAVRKLQTISGHLEASQTIQVHLEVSPTVYGCFKACRWKPAKTIACPWEAHLKTSRTVPGQLEPAHDQTISGAFGSFADHCLPVGGWQDYCRGLTNLQKQSPRFLRAVQPSPETFRESLPQHFWFSR